MRSGACVAGIVAFIVFAATNGTALAQGRGPMQVEAAPARAGLVVRTVDAVGTLRANEVVTIRPEISGVVSSINFAEGQAVKAGQVLVTMDDDIYAAELAQARASLELSRRNADRQRELLEKGAGTPRQLDEALSKLRFDQATADLAQARLDKARILAKFDGILGLRKVSTGEYLQAGDPIVTLQDIDPIKVDFRVGETHLADLAVGQSIEIAIDALRGRSFAGKVYAIDPQVDINGRAIVIRARVDNSAGILRPGLFARVQLIVDRRENAILVPEGALVPTDDADYVLRVVDGKAEQARVVTGHRQAREVEIVQGLEPGDVVITAGQLKIRPGTPVEVIEGGGATGETSGHI